MNLMLVAVVVVSLLIGQVSTGVIVGLLILLNVALGTRWEWPRGRVWMRWPRCRCRRHGWSATGRSR